MEFQSPLSKLDYLYDASGSLVAGENLSSATWDLESGLTGTGQADTVTGSTLDIATSDEVGTTKKASVRVTTSKGNIFTRDWYIRIQHQGTS